MKSLIEPGRYLHYKNREYRVIGSVRHSETEEELVLYYPLYDDEEAREYWVRPLAIFKESVLVSGSPVARFARIGD